MTKKYVFAKNEHLAGIYCNGEFPEVYDRSAVGMGEHWYRYRVDKQDDGAIKLVLMGITDYNDLMANA